MKRIPFSIAVRQLPAPPLELATRLMMCFNDQPWRGFAAEECQVRGMAWSDDKEVLTGELVVGISRYAVFRDGRTLRVTGEHPVYDVADFSPLDSAVFGKAVDIDPRNRVSAN